MTGNVIQLEGQRFGALVVLRREGRIGKHAAWLCYCDCGKQRVERGDKLRSGRILSCGISHRFYKTVNDVSAAERSSWNAMMQRCYNEKTPAYRWYGKLGVRVCKRWRESFENFLADMGPRPTPKHSLDRYPDTTGDYELTNCRWADAKEQARNRRGTVKVFWEGKQVPLVEVLEKRNLNERSIRKRLARGWTLDEALTIPMGEKRNEDYPVEWMLVYWGNKK